MSLLVLIFRDDKTQQVTWQKALAYVGISGLAMLLLSITFLVEKSMARVPNHIKLGTIIGIGMLLVSATLANFLSSSCLLH